VNRALAKLDDGTYGLSDISGRPIPRERLIATPEATALVQEAEKA
jgi:DnaK suppressor protein